ncbi:noroxomaritidine synthase 2-like [Tasmannia lanceolata]|uniref:noroxomaritidine synthase 2-like n=1 Tax=Tasmannia lanceolata TaxID=3420 RepID=UPI0040642DA3
MGSAWLLSLWSFLQNYPEILLALLCFFFLQILLSRFKDEVFVNWPLVGMLPSLLLNLHNFYDWGTQALSKSGCTFVFKGPWFANMEMLVTCDPANVNHILNANFSNYPKGSDFFEIFDILGDGIFNTDSESWKIQRKMAHTLINHRRFRKFVAESSREKVEKGLIPVIEHIAQQGKVVDLQDVMLRFMFDSTCILVFGIDPGCLSISFPTVQFAKAMDVVEEALIFRHTAPRSWWKLLRWLRMGEEKRLAEAWETIDHFIAQYISMRRKELEKPKKKIEGEEEEAIDLLTSYMDYQLEEGVSVPKSDRFLRDTTVNLMLAGRDTTSAALTWFFWIISKNPIVETKILEELKTILPEKEEVVQKIKPVVFKTEELAGLVYLHAALCESLRLFPPVHVEHKGVLEPDVLPSGEKVRPGMKILYSMYAMGRMEGVWGKDCLEFKPERWISESGKLRFEPSYKFLAFNAGPRSCLGKEVAFTQMKAVVSSMLYNFHVDVIEGHPVTPKISIILHMKHGLLVRVRERCL